MKLNVNNTHTHIDFLISERATERECVFHAYSKARGSRYFDRVCLLIYSYRVRDECSLSEVNSLSCLLRKYPCLSFFRRVMLFIVKVM